MVEGMSGRPWRALAPHYISLPPPPPPSSSTRGDGSAWWGERAIRPR